MIRVLRSLASMGRNSESRRPASRREAFTRLFAKRLSPARPANRIAASPDRTPNGRSSSAWLQQMDRMRDARRDPRQSCDQFLTGAHEFRDGHGRQTIDDEPEIPAVSVERGAFALPPIPSAASDAPIVPPHNFAGIGMFDYRSAVAHGIERLVPARHHQPGQARVPIHVLAAEAGAEPDAQGAIQDDNP